MHPELFRKGSAGAPRQVERKGKPELGLGREGAAPLCCRGCSPGPGVEPACPLPAICPTIWLPVGNRGEGAGRAGLTFVHHLKVDLFDDAGVVLVVLKEEQAVDVAFVIAGVVVGDVGDEDGQVLQVLGAPAAVPHHPALKTLILLQL